MAHYAKIGAGGEIVIPPEFCCELGFVEGDSIAVERVGESITLKSPAQVLREVQHAIKAMITDPFTVDDFIADRRAEAARE